MGKCRSKIFGYKGAVPEGAAPFLRGRELAWKAPSAAKDNLFWKAIDIEGEGEYTGIIK